MPAVDVAMERSLRGGFLDLLAASLRPALHRRDLAGQITDVRLAFSSWDNCMQATFCKWPVIAVIIVGGLILISVVVCIVRCACCGRSCCCSCFSCLRCCGNCCGCCDPPRGSRRKYLDEPYIPPDQGYKSQAPMHAGFAGPTAPVTKGPDYPQYAEFDVGAKRNEDALPEMPSWEGAASKKVPLEEEAVEMNALKKPDPAVQVGNSTGSATAVSSNSSRSPVNRSPYRAPNANPGPNDYFNHEAVGNDPYAQAAPAYNQPDLAYGQSDHGYGMAGAAIGPSPRSPHAYDNGYSNEGYGQAVGYTSPTGQETYGGYSAAGRQPYDNYNSYGSQGNPGYGISRHQSPHEMDAGNGYPQDSRHSPAPHGPYSAAGRYSPDSRRSPAPQGDYTRRSPAPGTEYGSGYDNRPGYATRGYSSESTRPLRAPPQRQYTSNSINDVTSPSGSQNNINGFDFSTSGYSRPPAIGGGVNSGGYRLPSPGPAVERGTAYPGYKPYQPAA